MRGKAIDKEWYKNDYTSGNKLFIEIESEKLKFNKTEFKNIYNIVASIKPDAMEYIHVACNDSKYRLWAKFKGQVNHALKAKLRKCIHDKFDTDLYVVQSVDSIDVSEDSVLHKGPAFRRTRDNLYFECCSKTIQTKDISIFNQPIKQHFSVNNKIESSGIYLIDSVKHYKLGSSCNIYKRLYAHSTSLGIPTVHLIIYTKDYKLLENVLLRKFKKYLVSQSCEIINSELININAIIYDIIKVCNVLDIDYTPDHNYQFIKKSRQ